MKPLIAFTPLILLFGVACDGNITATEEVADVPLAAKAAGGGGKSLIAYASDADGDLDIYVANADGSAPADNVTDYSPDADVDPVFSPDGRTIAFVSTRNGNQDLYLVTLDGTGTEERLTSHIAADYAPTFSPDGNEIAFATMRNGDPDIYVLDLVTRKLRVLAASGGVVEVSPAWSPGGRLIAYRAGGDIYTIRADGSQPPEQLTTHWALDDMPAWLADGSEVSFVTWRNGNPDIYAIEIAYPHALRPVVNGGSGEFSHAWSVDGLAYTAGLPTGGSGDIFVFPYNGPIYNLTPGPGLALDINPDWWVGGK